MNDQQQKSNSGTIALVIGFIIVVFLVIFFVLSSDSGTDINVTVPEGDAPATVPEEAPEE
jgi:hypothetical protein